MFPSSKFNNKSKLIHTRRVLLGNFLNFKHYAMRSLDGLLLSDLATVKLERNIYSNMQNNIEYKIFYF